ncbi:transposase [Candidatus Micrarchaeota archaeon]|nr:transposase [Candidatus Micrarchaeota archaeon]
MGKVRRIFDRQFKLAVVRDLEGGKRLSEVCREHQIREDLACRWRNEYRSNPQHAFAGKGVSSTADARCNELEREVGKLHMQVEFLKKCVESLQARLVETRTEG